MQGKKRTFSIRNKIDEGAQAELYASDVNLSPGEIPSTEYLVKKVDKRENPNWEREIEIMEQLKGHPNFIQYEDHCEDKNFVYILLEWIEGYDFERVLEAKKE